MIQQEDLKRLKNINKIERICAKKTNEYSRDIVDGLMKQVSMLQKQKKFLQKKLREVYESKTKTNTTRS
jgi:hypothetical protein